MKTMHERGGEVESELATLVPDMNLVPATNMVDTSRPALGTVLTDFVEYDSVFRRVEGRQDRPTGARAAR